MLLNMIIKIGMMMELFFLGTSGSNPTVFRSLPAICLRYNGRLYLLDCGEGTQRQLMKQKIGFGSIDLIFVSHLHLDHFLGVFGLIKTMIMNQREKPIKIIAPKGFSKFIDMFFQQKELLEIIEINKKTEIEEAGLRFVFFPNNHLKNSFGVCIQEKDRLRFNAKKAHRLGLAGLDFKEIQKKGSIEKKGKEILLKDVAHEVNGEKICYTGDTAFDETILPYVENSDVLIHDATYLKQEEQEAKLRKHSTAEEAALIAKKANVKKLILTHISPRYSNYGVIGEQAKKIFENSLEAYDGLKIIVKKSKNDESSID